MRDGSGIYTYPPGTPGVAGQTIFSARYNTFLDDLATTLNTVLPINMGGTGAGTAATGPFVQKAGDTMTGPLVMAPAAANAFYTLNATSGYSANILGRKATKDRWFFQMPDAANETGSDVGSNFNLYRCDDAGTPFAAPVMTSIRSTGSVAFSGAVTTNGQLICTTGNMASYGFVGDINKGLIYLSSGGTRYLYYDGTNYNLNGAVVYALNGRLWGASDGTPIWTTGGTINGVLSINSGAATGFNLTANVAYFAASIFNNYTGAGGHALSLQSKNDSNWSLAILNAASTVWSHQFFGNGNYIFNGTISGPYVRLTGFMQVIAPGATDSALNVAAHIGYSGGGAQYGMSFRHVTDGTTAISFQQAGGAGVGSIGVTGVATSFNTSSGAELKEDLKTFDAGHIVDQTEVYDFAWKATGERAYGVLAQQANEVYPQAVTYQNGQGEDWWGVDYSKYVPVLLQELKSLRARVAQLEGQALTGTQPA